MPAVTELTFHLTLRSAEYRREWVDSPGALICGRTLFDFTDGWGGQHTMGVPVVAVTHEVPTEWVDDHPDAPFLFVSEGVEAAAARAQSIDGDRVVAVTGGTIAGQCLDLGLLDEMAVDLVPVVMGRVTAPFFGTLSKGNVLLGNPTVCVVGDRAAHLACPVMR